MTDREHAGLVIANHGSALVVEAGDGMLVRCVARRSAGAIVCGDRVAWQPQTHGPAVITAHEPRRTLLSRPDPRGKPKLLCANIDLLVVTTALRPPATGPVPNPELVDSYLVAAELLGIDALVVVNKIDLAAGADIGARLDEGLRPWRAAGYGVVLTSVTGATGLDELRALLGGRCAVLVGESGVGKSSLIDALAPGNTVRIGELSVAGGFGRHTTTVTTLFHLPDGGDIIDSPGVREFRLWPVDARELANGFREFRPHLGACRFRDCRHHGEPGCAIAAAVADGRISAARYRRYRSLLEAVSAGAR